MGLPEASQEGGRREAIRVAISKLPSRVRTRAQNAWRGFELAIMHLEADREIASFRAITAQEEAATALFMALKEKGYPGSDRLNVREHRHKAALWPFLEAVKRRLIKDLPGLSLNYVIDPSEPSISVKIPIRSLMNDPELPDYAISMLHPLDLLHSVKGQPYLFQDELKEVSEHLSATSIERLVSKLSNARNGLLYASDQSLPKSRAQMKDILGRRDQAENALVLTIAVMQTDSHQAMVLQSLEAFLGIVGKSEGLAMPYPVPPDSLVDINLTRTPRVTEAPDG